MRVISWNVNGLRAVHKKGFLDWLSSEDPDILCLQETKAHEEQLPEEVRSVAGYHSFFSTPERKGYSGVGLYTKKAPDSVQFGFGDRFDAEGRTIIESAACEPESKACLGRAFELLTAWIAEKPSSCRRSL